MRQIHLRVTYRDDGTPFAAYFHLPSKPNEKRAKCHRVEPGMILDINKEGKLIGEFEPMYQNSVGVPWHQDEQDFWIDVRLTIEMLRSRAPVGQVVDYGCGLGYYLDILVRGLNAGGGQGFDISETAVGKPRGAFPGYNFQQADITVSNNPALKLQSVDSGITAHVIRGTL